LDLQSAALKACGTLAFVTPEIAIPLLLEEVKRKLSLEIYKWITPTDIQIWKAPEGVVVIDGTSSKLPHS
jgi:hypothetical protein